MSKLGQHLEASKANKGGKPGEETPSKLAAFLASGARGKHARLPIFGKVWIELCSHDRLNEIEGDTFNEMKRLSLELAQLTELTYTSDKIMRVLAWSVRDADDHAEHWGTVEEWGRIDSDLIAACNRVYLDVRNELDPLGVTEGAWGDITEEQRVAIRFAYEKKNRPLLLSFGSVTLANFILTSEFQRETSPTPSSSPGVSPSGNSTSD